MDEWRFWQSVTGCAEPSGKVEASNRPPIARDLCFGMLQARNELPAVLNGAARHDESKLVIAMGLTA